MTFEELVGGYLARLRDPRTRYLELKKIITEIDNLVYEEDRKPLSDAYKLRIITSIRDGIVDTRVFSEEAQVYKSSNDDFMELINITIGKLGGK